MMRFRRAAFRVVSICACMATIALGLTGAPARGATVAPAAQAAMVTPVALAAKAAPTAVAANVTASGPIVSGIAGKCADDYGNSSSDGAIVDLWDCNGTGAQDWSVMDDGTIQINGKCLDIIGAGTTDGTLVDIWDCNGGGNQQWQQQGGALVNPASGLCLDDPGSTTSNGTQLQIYDCNGTAAQQWSLPSTNSTTSAPTITYPGGDLVVSADDGGIPEATVSQYLSTYLPADVGAPAGASLSTLFQDTYAKTSGADPGITDPPTFDGGSLTVSGSTITIDIPAADVQANANVPGWAASLIAAVVGGISGALAYAACLWFFSVPVALYVHSLCGFMWTFIWTLVGFVLHDALTGVPLNNVEVWKSIMTYALAGGAVGAAIGFIGPWMLAEIPGGFAATRVAVAAALGRLSTWFKNGVRAIVDTVSGWFSTVEADAPIELPGIVGAAGLATPGNSGAITSGIAGKCVDDSAGGTSNGTVVQLWDCNGTDAQNWTVYSNGNISEFGRCLDIVGNGTANNTKVQLWECNGAGGQVWQQEGNALVNPQSGRCLDDPASSTNDGTQLQIYDCNGTAAQQWILPGGSAGANNQSPALRVLPFGDSITNGIGSSTGSGYRCDLESVLANYQFVGSLTAGTGCSQEQNEGHSGWTIGNLASIENCTITGYEPNVVLLDIGTNDVNVNTGGVDGGSPSAAASAIENLIGSIQNDDPGVVIVVGGLIPTPITQVAANMTSFNSQVSGWVSQQQSAGALLVWADMSAVTTGDLSDGLHPNDTGYQLMANAWANGIDTAINNGWINAPNAPATGSGCSSGGSGGGGSAPPAPTWTGLGEVAPGVQASGWTDALGQYIQYADVTGSGRADYLFIRPDSSVLGWYNPGVSSTIDWQSMGLVAPGIQGSGWTPGDGNIQFADMTGDGRADYLWVRPDSSVMMWYNSGLGSDGDPVWLPMGQIAAGVQGSGWTPGDGNIQFADMNGDGRADYLWVRPDSSVLMWENPGINPAQPGGYNWIPEGEIAPGVQASGWTDSPGQFVTFADLTGSGRADYLFIRPDSSVLAWYNPGVSNGINWQSMGLIAPGVQGSGWTGPTDGNIQFADMNGDSRADYIWTRPDSSMLLWLNNPG